MQKTTALFTITWFISLSYLAESHLGHQHDLLPQDTGVCSINCRVPSHHRGFFECIWFHLKTSSRGLTTVQELTFSLAFQTDLTFNPRLETLLNVFNTIPARAPPLT
ncbi:MAG: hypothetical protein ACE5D2_07685 [Fidelibacterota bacterium]